MSINLKNKKQQLPPDLFPTSTTSQAIWALFKKEVLRVNSLLMINLRRSMTKLRPKHRLINSPTSMQEHLAQYFKKVNII